MPGQNLAPDATAEYNPVAYPSHMATKKNPDPQIVKQQLEALREERDSFAERRRAAVEQARAQKMTYREIALHLGMTEQGLRKALGL